MAIREQVSGPGRNSKRTDMNVSKQPVRYMSNGSYGEGQELLGLQSQADLYAAPSTPTTPASVMQAFNKSKPVTQINAPTERPNEPQTAGMPFGAGSNFINLPPSNQRTPATVAQEMLNNPAVQDIAGVAEVFIAMEGQSKGFGY